MRRSTGRWRMKRWSPYTLNGRYEGRGRDVDCDCPFKKRESFRDLSAGPCDRKTDCRRLGAESRDYIFLRSPWIDRADQILKKAQGMPYYEKGFSAGSRRRSRHFLYNILRKIQCHRISLQIFRGRAATGTGYARYDFKLDGVDCILVKPNVRKLPGRPWYHRARFFGAFPFADLALLERGWCVTSTDVVELYGSPEAVRRLNRFYDFMVSKGYHKGAVIAGYSRGGLITYNWAEKYPEKVACL